MDKDKKIAKDSKLILSKIDNIESRAKKALESMEDKNSLTAKGVFDSLMLIKPIIEILGLLEFKYELDAFKGENFSLANLAFNINKIGENVEALASYSLDFFNKKTEEEKKGF
jgi:hypothetical protein